MIAALPRSALLCLAAAALAGGASGRVEPGVGAGVSGGGNEFSIEGTGDTDPGGRAAAYCRGSGMVAALQQVVRIGDNRRSWRYVCRPR